jgi:hypothetical protein
VTTLAVIALALLAAAADRPPANPYEGALAYAACMRAHGVPHPDPDRKGNFSLSPADEAKLRAVGRAKVRAGDAACFHFIKPFASTKPLSPQAMAQARAVLREVANCMARAGFELGRPVVRNLPRGRAFFGYADDPAASKPSAAMNAVGRACERKLAMAKKLDAIVAADRAPI